MALWSERVLLALPHDSSARRGVTPCWTDLRGETDSCYSTTVTPERKSKIFWFPSSYPLRLAPRSSAARQSRHYQKPDRHAYRDKLVLESDMGQILRVVYREQRDGTGPSRLDFSAHWRADNENPALQEFLKLLSEGYSPPAVGRWSDFPGASVRSHEPRQHRSDEVGSILNRLNGLLSEDIVLPNALCLDKHTPPELRRRSALLRRPAIATSSPARRCRGLAL
ncbi:hypothetical protein ABIE89_000312 [Bradyrhizobium niftali]